MAPRRRHPGTGKRRARYFFVDDEPLPPVLLPVVLPEPVLLPLAPVLPVPPLVEPLLLVAVLPGEPLPLPWLALVEPLPPEP